MPCPKCNSHNLWDDEQWWGCRDCKFMSNSIHNKVSPKDKFNDHLKYRKS